MKSVSTFWKGEALSNQEKACLASFVGLGHQVELYSFDKVVNLPQGVNLVDAHAVDDGSLIQQFFYNGKPSFQLYSDYFRLKMMAKTDSYWIDSDVVLLTQAELPEGLVIGLEDQTLVCNAVLRIPPDQPGLAELIGSVENLARKELTWGETGHVLLQEYLKSTSQFQAAESAEIFYPVHWSEFWKPFLPEFRDECQELCASAKTLHLWNNLIVQMGFWKKLGPPKGSFLYEAYEKSDALYAFDDFYPPDLMYRLVENWVARDGGDLGVKRVFRILGSSVRNTGKKFLGKDSEPFLNTLPSRSPLAKGSR